MKKIPKTKKGTTTIPCLECDGTGIRLDTDELDLDTEATKCPDCNGTGVMKVTLEEQQ